LIVALVYVFSRKIWKTMNRLNLTTPSASRLRTGGTFDQ
jgi:hypothetical protein